MKQASKTTSKKKPQPAEDPSYSSESDTIMSDSEQGSVADEKLKNKSVMRIRNEIKRTPSSVKVNF